MIFSFDAIISFIILLFAVLVFTTTTAQNATGEINSLESFELEEKTLLVADSFVKNYDSNNTLLGACITDKDKKRILANTLSFANISQAKPLELGDIYAKSVDWKTKNSRGTILLSQIESKNCLTARRFVLIDGEKGTAEVTLCRKN